MKKTATQAGSISKLQRWPGIRSVGARTGLFTGPLLAFDFDGEVG